MEEIEAWLVRDKDNTLMLVIGAKPVKLFQMVSPKTIQATQFVL